MLYSSGHILHVLWIPFAATVLYLVTVAVNYIRATMEKRRISNTFRRYVAPEIVTELLREGTDSLGLGGKLTDIAVLFVDIRGFTTMSEVLTPPQVVEILNEYLTLTTKCIMNNHGTLDKFVGDCTMAIWNAPLPQEDYIYNAVKTAWDMVEGSKALSARLQEQFGRTVSFGIGVNCGPAVVGNIGAEMRMDFTAIGDTVNTAARLEANAPGGLIYISRTVADALEGRILVTSLGDSIRLKGKAEGFEILRMEGLMEAPLRVE
jgi:adenylate cyclase